MQKHWKGVRGLKCYIYKNLLAWHYILSPIVDHNKLFINKNLCPYFKISWSKTLSHLSKIDSLFISGNATKIEHCLKSIRIRSFLARIFTHSDWIQNDTSVKIIGQKQKTLISSFAQFCVGYCQRNRRHSKVGK